MSVACSGLGLDVPVGVHQHRDGLVALVGVRLRLEDLLVHRQRPPGEVAVDAEDLLPDLVACGPCTMLVVVIAPGFTMRVHLGALVLLDRDDRVEHLAGGVHAHVVGDRLDARLLHHQRHREDLRDRLDRHLGLDVAHRVDLAVDRDQRDAEEVRVDLGERGDVVGVLALLQVLVLREGRLQCGLESRPRSAPGPTRGSRRSAGPASPAPRTSNEDSLGP